METKMKTAKRGSSLEIDKGNALLLLLLLLASGQSATCLLLPPLNKYFKSQVNRT